MVCCAHAKNFLSNDIDRKASVAIKQINIMLLVPSSEGRVSACSHGCTRSVFLIVLTWYDIVNLSVNVSLGHPTNCVSFNNTYYLVLL